MELFYDNIYEYYLYLHNTCKDFYNKLKSIDITNLSSIFFIDDK